MKKALISIALGAAVTASAVDYKEQLFFNGWNLYATNGATLVVGGTNNLFTTFQGQVFYSLTNNIINGTLNTNSIAPDAFDSTTVMFSDANGDINANAAIHYVINNTNWVPIVVTNSQGQWFVTNTWPLAQAQYPTYMYPATTNYYPLYPNANSTNAITFNFQRGWAYGSAAAPILVWDTSTNVFTFTVYGNGITPVTGATNIPTSFLQGANRVRLNSVVAAAQTPNSANLINEVSYGQPVP